MIAVVDYHKGNLKSVERGLAATGADARITDDASVIAGAEAIVLPGVGAFADAAASMRELGQLDILRERIRAGVPFLGICLGLHLLYEAGEEHAEGKPTPGLGIIPGTVKAVPRGLAVSGSRLRRSCVSVSRHHQLSTYGIIRN